MNSLMVDIETLSSEPDAAIISIGAVGIVDYKEICSGFYVNVDANQPNRHIDHSTVEWWFSQKDEIIKATLINQLPLVKALQYLSHFYSNLCCQEIWSNGADFDCLILTRAMRTLHIKCSWSFRDHRCYRTIKNLYPHIKRSNTDNLHNAFSDAKNQAQHLIDIFKEIKYVSSPFDGRTGTTTK